MNIELTIDFAKVKLQQENVGKDDKRAFPTPAASMAGAVSR
jgi:hypothetical protein